jgi:hypothetical protein
MRDDRAGKIIGKLDADGNLMLVVDQAILPPEISDALFRLGMLGTTPKRKLEHSAEPARCSLNQNSAERER